VPLLAAGLVGATIGAAGPVAASGSHQSGGSAKSSGKHLSYCYGKINKIRDGDTVDVKLTDNCFGNHKGSTLVIRNAGIQATEVHNHECWASAARKDMESLAPMHHKVQLSAYKSTLTDRQTPTGQARYLMYVDAKRPVSKGGPWVDVQAAELKSGLVMDKRQTVENAHDSHYATLMQKAMHKHLGMWGDPHHCGAKDYAPHAKLQSWIGWKTDGADDPARANEEWFRVRNVGNKKVNLSHWKARDGSHQFGGGTHTYFKFPKGTELKPGQTLSLHPGDGTQDKKTLDFHDNLPDLPFYRNATMPSSNALGAHLSHHHAEPGAETILTDPKKNMRSWAVYPCVVHCTAPDLKIVKVQPRTKHESIVIRNKSRSKESLTGVVLDYDGLTKEFKPSTVLRPGAKLHVHVAHNGHDTNKKAYWSHSGHHMLSNSGGKVWLRTAADVTIDVSRWGNGGHYHYHT
jgi:endonuclease YncB( thermonuclease family)